jgi:prepilin-type N-terminal cleavage/methylation domain-containing protein
MENLKNEKGFTLIEMMITMALLVVAMEVMADSVTLQNKTQTNSNSEMAITSLFDQVQGIAGAEWSCTAGLAGATSTGALTVKDPLNLSTVASVGTGSGKFWSLTQVKLQNIQNVPGQPGVQRGDLYLEAGKNMALNMGAPTLSRLIPDIYFETNPDGTIARCYTTSDTIAAAQSACQLLGGTWNPAAAAGSQCQLPVKGA